MSPKTYIEHLIGHFNIMRFLLIIFCLLTATPVFAQDQFPLLRKVAKEKGFYIPADLDSINLDSLKLHLKGLPPKVRRRAKQLIKRLEREGMSATPTRPFPPKVKNELRGFLARKNRELEDSIMQMIRVKPEVQEEIDNMVEEISSYDAELAKQELILSKKQLMIDALQMERDSIDKRVMQDSLILAMKDAEIASREMALQEAELGWYRSIGIALIALMLGGVGFILYMRSRKFNKVLQFKNEAIKEAQDKSEKLLLNILPKPIAEELKEKGNALPKSYDQVSILFTDFKNFSQISTQLSADQLVQDLDYCFKNFDDIVGKYKLEKIKTIGDAYMCAGGLPMPDGNHPIQIVHAALEMQKFLSNWKIERIGNGQIPFEARVGIHTGPLVAGVVGAKKFAYDVWGSTVNIAARMEAHGEPGKVNISASTYDLVKDAFDCVHRGKIPAKNMGEIDMYFVSV